MMNKKALESYIAKNGLIKYGKTLEDINGTYSDIKVEMVDDMLVVTDIFGKHVIKCIEDIYLTDLMLQAINDVIVAWHRELIVEKRG